MHSVLLVMYADFVLNAFRSPVLFHMLLVVEYFYEIHIRSAICKNGKKSVLALVGLISVFVYRNLF
jgi:hypothetical protein